MRGVVACGRLERRNFRWSSFWGVLLGTVSLWGCSRSSPEAEEPAQRPVSVLILKEDAPAPVIRVSGSVGSWKTEDLGFEVSGRVTRVIEPEKDIEGRDLWISGRTSEPTELARLDDSRYVLKANSAKAEMDAMDQKIEAVKIERDDVIPAQIAAAEADREFSAEDYNRKNKLFERNAATRQELDAAKAQIDAAKARVAQLTAQKEAKAAEVTSLDAQRDQQKNDWEEAKRNVEDCVLFSPFRGQVAQVHVIPGGYVERGQPVVTVQMMDPIKIDFEVSAETVRKLPNKGPVEISFADKDGTTRRETAFIYQTDPTADPATRTFTVTLLFRNEKIRPAIPEEYRNVPLPRTPEVWRMNRGLTGTEDQWFLEKQAIDEDKQGPFLWQVELPEPPPKNIGPILKVKKVRVQRGDLELSIVDLYHLVNVSLPDSGGQNPQDLLFTAKLSPPEKWDGKTVLLDQNQWLLRPGDLVNVHLKRGERDSGFFVPMNSVKNEPDGQSVFVVETTGGKSTLKRTPVKLVETIGTRVRIEPADGTKFTTGTPIVVGRVHYLQDDEPVRIAETIEEAAP